MYDELERLLKADKPERPLKQKYEQFLSEYFFDGKKIELTPRNQKDVVYVMIGDEDDFPIYELGDGLQQILIMTYPLFFKKNRNLLLFIEEPELYLHPGLQRKLMQILTSDEFGSLQVFLTTHSNHFLDMTLDFEDISIFKFTKKFEDDNKSKAIFEIKDTKYNDRNLLQCLGVNNSSVMLSNCTIWVEGITDRMYLRHYFDIYQKEKHSENNSIKIFEEDKHYSFVEYSGNNITHWSFLDDESGIDIEKLCGKLFLIADQDVGKITRHEKLKEKLGDRYYPLNCREIENLITPKILHGILLSYKEKEDNLNIPQNSTAYRDCYLGEFIETKILLDKTKTERKNKNHPYSTDSGTIKDKVKFAQKAISNIKTLSDMSEEAKALCERIYNFIKDNNPE